MHVSELWKNISASGKNTPKSQNSEYFWSEFQQSKVRILRKKIIRISFVPLALIVFHTECLELIF